MAWTEERVELLKGMWADGLPASVIAERLGGGISRGSVNGKAWRLGLAERSTGPGNCKPRNGCIVPSRPKKFVVQGNSGVVKPAKVTDENCTDYNTDRSSDAAALAVAQATPSTCRWPIGDPMSDNDFHFCGARKTPVSPYCKYHLWRRRTNYSVKNAKGGTNVSR